MSTQSTAETPARSDERESAAAFVYEVDGTTYEHDRPRISGAEIMSAADISPSEGLVQILPDGTTATVNVDDEITLVPGTQFRRRPRFRRG